MANDWRRSRRARKRTGTMHPAQDLLVRFREGDEAAFEEIVGAYQGRLVQFFFRLCWDRDGAEDLAQDLFIKLLRGARRYQPQGKLSTFIFRVATNLWIDHYRSLRPRPRLYSLDRALHRGVEKGRETTPAALLPGDESGPLERAIDHEERLRLRQALESLTEPHRLVFELAVYQQMPYAEIGKVLAIPVGTVKSRMHNSVKALKALLAEDAEEAGRETAREAGPGGDQPGSFRTTGVTA